MQLQAMSSAAFTACLLVAGAWAGESPQSESNPATITEPAGQAQPHASGGDAAGDAGMAETTSAELTDDSAAPAAEELEEVALDDPNQSEAQ
ncbi:MAG TPA: hypothetical protein VLB75_07930 [Steroidobacteraceae bacterium]|nr:hypothetical protein [Steroidobacteraceae bacterium]